MKNTIRKTGTKIVSMLLALMAVLLAVAGGSFTTAKADDTEAAVRTVSLDGTELTSMTEFTAYTMQEENGVPTFDGTTDYMDDGGLFFDNVALQGDEEDYSIGFHCTFDMESLVFNLEMSVQDKNTGEILETETIETPAFVTSGGGLDAYVDLDGEQYLLSDLVDGAIDDCSLFGKIVAFRLFVPPVVKIYYMVADSAEKIKSIDNRKYNRELEASGEGVALRNYIYSQEETGYSGYKAGNYRFGFTTFGGVGCEVASAYNALISLGKPEMLSETIFAFEALSIEFAIAWGNFGSDPVSMTRFFKARGIRYEMYTNIDQLSIHVNAKDKCSIIMSRWNSTWTGGLHTFYIEKNSSWNTQFHGFNKKNKIPGVTIDNNTIASYNDGKAFIVGYILYAY